MGALSIIKNVPKLLRHGGNKLIFVMKKAQPQILVGGGALLIAGSFVWAIVNARKMDQTMAESNEKIDDIHTKMAALSEQEDSDEKATQMTELKKELLQAKADGIFKMFVLMGIPVLVFAGGMCFMIGGHLIQVRRFGELSTAFAMLQRTYDRYREMNIREHGEECDRRYRYGIVGEVKDEYEADYDEKQQRGEQHKLPVVDGNPASLYTFIFSEEFSRKCPRDPVCTISFLRAQERYWNCWMESTGKPVTLSMIIEDLGIVLDPDDPANDYILIAGWRPNGDGDRRIDFGIMRAVNKETLDMKENVVVLNFNCDGNIYHSTRYLKDGKKVC